MKFWFRDSEISMFFVYLSNKTICLCLTQLRETAMLRLASMINTSIDSVIAPLIATLAEIPREFSPLSAELGTTSVLHMSRFLIANNSQILFRDFVSRSKNIMAAMGMIMMSTSINLDPRKEITYKEWTVPKVLT